MTAPAAPTSFVRSGKVRDLYAVDDERLLLVASDRISAFDVVLPTPIPDKGRVLTGLSRYWFAQTAAIVPNHLLSTDPADLPSFVEPLLNGHDLAKGSRLAEGRPARMPRYRWLGNKVLAHTYNLLYGTHYTDVCSGYNAFWKSSFQRLELTHDNCEMEQQLLARARKAGLKIAEVAHGSEGRLCGSSKVSGIKQGLIDWWVIVKERFLA